MVYSEGEEQKEFRRRCKVGHSEKGTWIEENMVTTMFFTDFGDNWNARDLFMEFKELGMIEEIVIPPKRDWRGKRFGFVRFINASDEKNLETKMDNVWLDGVKLKANISKIKRKEVLAKGRERNKQTEGLVKGSGRKIHADHGLENRVPNESIPAKWGGSGPSKSFLEAITGTKTKIPAVNKEANKSFFFSTSESDSNRYRKAKVGVARRPGLAYGVAQSLLEEGFFYISASALGPNLCLLEEEREGELANLLTEGGEWKDQWFKEVRDWRKTDAECARVAWISIYGIPCFVRNENFINLLLADIGTVVNSQSITEKPIRLDVLTLMIYTESMEQIRNKVKACIDGNWYNLLVIEDVSFHKEETEGSSRCSNSCSEEEEAFSPMGLPDGEDEASYACPTLNPKRYRNPAQPPSDNSGDHLKSPRVQSKFLGGDGYGVSEAQKLESDISKKKQALCTSINDINSVSDNLFSCSGKATTTDPISMKTSSRGLEIVTSEISPLRRKEDVGFLRVGPAGLVANDSSPYFINRTLEKSFGYGVHTESPLLNDPVKVVNLKENFINDVEKEVGPSRLNLNETVEVDFSSNSKSTKAGTKNTTVTSSNFSKKNVSFQLKKTNFIRKKTAVGSRKFQKLSFDDQCQIVKNSKNTRKKIREVLDLGERVLEFSHPIQSGIQHRKIIQLSPGSQANNKTISFAKNNYLSGGIPLTCESISSSNIRNCNRRGANSGSNNAAEGIWNSISRLGIINISENFDPIKSLKEMELRDHKEEKVAKGTQNHAPP
ncbi:uncharacterized protein LOC131605958 [Vicia villosa]|uniref:uncharacterized protein LOC131605958 n=1 Tax=Vicia villosa TaxID=3911 RepID=UPI00273B480C|nr:uncharacterized protein LOC131605958 [Vicia villosa]